MMMSVSRKSNKTKELITNNSYDGEFDPGSG
jgi:hypothetical protein